MPYLFYGPLQLARQAGPRWGAPYEHALARFVAHPGVDLGRRRQPGTRQVCLGQARAAVVGAHVAVDVEHPGGVSCGVDVPSCERPQQFCRPAWRCQLFHAPAQRADLRCPVEADEPADVGGAQTGKALGACFAEQGAEHDGEHERPQRVKSGAGSAVDLGERVEEPGRGQRRQHEESARKRQRRPLGYDGLGTEQHTSPGQGPFVLARQGLGEGGEGALLFTLHWRRPVG